MKILLINPPGRTSFVTPPLGLMYLAASLKKAGHQPLILDFLLEKFTPEALFKKLTPEIKVIGITAVTPNIAEAVSLADFIKKNFPEKIIIFGGPHPSLLPRETLASSKSIDFVLKGEGEERMCHFLDYLEGKRKEAELDGIISRKNKEIFDFSQKKFIENLDDLPFPARELVSIEEYSEILESREKPATTLITSRGCPFHCIYCSKPIFGNVFRARSPENVVKEIEFLKEKYKIRELIFYDDTFTFNRERTVELCNLLIEKKLNIKWKCETRVNLVDEELLELMKKAGCYLIGFGIESGNSRILNILKKGITIEQVRIAVKAAKKVGIEILGYFILGIPGETEKEIKETINFAKSLDVEYAQFSIATAFPGTELYQIAKSSGRLPDLGESFYALAGKVDFSLCDVPPKELQRYLRKAYSSFYLRPKYIFSKVKKIRSFYDIFFYLKNLKNLIIIIKP
ncbi:MAG: radical SAM protein [Candidatus Pacebacteria bacterium]|nr:radical SAM protein [Candidatus Paceibacterota bacterium]